AAAPVIAGDAVLGALALALPRGVTLSDDDQALLLALAAQAAVAMRGGQLLEETERRRRHAEALVRLGHSLSRTLDAGAVGQRVVDELCQLCAAHVAALWSLDEDGSGDFVALAVSAGGDHPIHVGMRVAAGMGAIGRAARSRAPVATADVLAD